MTARSVRGRVSPVVDRPSFGGYFPGAFHRLKDKSCAARRGVQISTDDDGGLAV